MELQQFAKLLKQKSAQLSDLIRRKMPVFAGRMAKDFYQDNFRKGGYVNDGLHPWEPAKRLSSGAPGAGANYGTLLSGRNHLFSSTRYTPGDGRVRVYNDVPYASAHQNGETITPTVTPKMRKFGWAKYFKAGGGKDYERKVKEADSNKVEEIERWKGLALTKKKKLKIKLPVRPFITESKELNQQITDKQAAEISKILNS